MINQQRLSNQRGGRVNKVYSFLFIYVTFFFAFAFSVIPWASDFIAFKPYWVLVVLIYWSHTEMEKILYFTPLVIGLLVDSITNSPLGQHAICFIVITFLTRRLFPATRAAGALVELLTIALLILCYSMLNNFLGIFSYSSIGFGLAFWFPIVISTLVWWWFKFILDYLQISFNLKSRVQ